MSETRRTVTVKLPTGWTRSIFAGAEAAIIGWVVPTIVGVSFFWLLASNPWMRDVEWESGAQIGGNFWSLSLGGQAPLGQLQVGFWPLLWTLFQVLLVRLSFFTVRSVDKYAVFAAIPSFVFLAFVLVFASSDGSAWRTVVGALVVSIVGTFWAYLDVSRQSRHWGWGWDGVKLGTLWFLAVSIVSLVFALASWSTNHSRVSAELAELGENTGSFIAIFSMFIPNLAGWAWSWIIGAGIIGPGGTIVSQLHPRSGGFGFPFWNLVPQTGGSWVIYWVPTMLGLSLGIITVWRRRRANGHKVLANLRVLVVASIFFLGLVLALLFLSGGSLGNGNLSYLGPNVWAAFGWTALKFLLPLALVVALLHADTFQGVAALTHKLTGKQPSKETSSADENAKQGEDVAHETSSGSYLANSSAVDLKISDETEGDEISSPTRSVRQRRLNQDLEKSVDSGDNLTLDEEK